MANEVSTDNNVVLTNKDLRKAFWAFLWASLACLTMERMIAPGLVNMFIAMRDKLYPNDPEKQKDLAARHCVFWNTQPTLGAIVPGITLGLEVEKARGGKVDNDLIQAIKAAVGGPFAGIGDSLIQGILIPLLCSIGMGLSADGSPIGVIFFIVSYCVINYPLSWFMFKTGYNLGVDGAEKILAGGVKDRIVSSVEILGLVVIGCTTATYAHVNTGLVYTSGAYTLDINATLESIFPGLLTLCFAFLTYRLIKVKKLSMAKIMLIYMAIAFVGKLTHILA